MDWYVEVLRKYAVFSGRARRKEYWMFVLLNLVICVLLSIVDAAFIGTQILSSVYSLAMLLPSIAVLVRRLHDTGRSGWWFLITFIPIIGVIVLLVFLIKDSDPGENEYGENPKGNYPVAQ